MPAFLSELSFLHPAGLWALAAVAIPVLIHLFNRSRGRLVKIGHIDLIRDARKLKVTELKLADWLLLFLRVCLFTLAALILAGLALPGLSSSTKATAYVSPAWLKHAGSQAVTELLQQYSDQETTRLLLLTEGFPEINEQVVAQSATSGQTNNLWPLLAERLSLEDHQQTVEVYAVDNLSQFGASKPILPRQVNWNLIHGEAEVASNPTPVTAIVAYDSSRKTDADVLSATLTSLRANRLPSLSWKLMDADDLADGEIDVNWLFLLSDNIANANFLHRIKGNEAAPDTVLTDAYGASRNVSDPALRLPFYPFTEFRVSRIGEPVQYPYTLLDLPGNQPLLQQTHIGDTRELHFNSRFITEWSSIARQPEFPELLLQWMMTDDQQANAFEGSAVPVTQLTNMPDTTKTDSPLPRRSVQSVLAALMVLLWLLERWLSERKRHVRR